MPNLDLAAALATAGQALPELTFKAAILLATAGALAFVLRRRSAALRHLVWSVAIAGVLALPVLQLIPLRLAVLPASLSRGEAPAMSVAPPAAAVLPPAAAAPAPLPVAATPAEAGSDRTTLLAIVWLIGAAVLLLRLGVGTATAWWLARTGERIDDEAWTVAADRISRGFDAPSARLVRSRWTDMPMTWGFIRPVVLLPADCDEWPDERREVVLRHELAHVARRDVLTLALAEVVRAVHWFNPLTWFALHQLRAEAERCCDDWVLRNGTRASTYAGHLLEMVRIIGRARVPAAVALPMAQRSTFEGRLLAILEPGIERGAPGARRALTTVAGVAALVVALGAMRPVEPARPGAAPAERVAEQSQVPAALEAEPAAAAPPPNTPAGRAAQAEAAPAPSPAGQPAPADTLTPDQLIAMRAVGVTPGYITEMRATFGPLTAEQLVSLRAVGVTPGYVAELRRHGYANLSAREASGLRALGVDGSYAAGMAAAGYPRLTVNQLSGLRAVGVTPGYVRDMGRLGYRGVPVADLTGMRAVGVTPAFVEGMGAAGYPGLSVEELTSLRALGVTPAYVQEMAGIGFRNLPAGRLGELRAVGVTPSYVADLRAAGLDGLDAETLKGLRAVGVTGVYIRELDAAGLRGLSVRDLNSLRAHGVTGAYLRELTAAGFGPLSADQLIRLRASGADRELIESRNERGIENRNERLNETRIEGRTRTRPRSQDPR